MIAKFIRARADEEKVRVLAFVEDAAASGGYFIACAADEIIADRFSIIGSVGVIHSSFGLEDAIGKLGVKRRIHTAGSSKSQNDPFVPEKPEDVAKLHAMLDHMHGEFKAFVKERRAGKLRASDEVLFNGDYWPGTKAVELGLADGIGDVRTTVRERFGKGTRMLLIPRRTVFGVPMSDAGSSVWDAVRDRVGASAVAEVLRAISDGGAFEARESFRGPPSQRS